MQERAHLGVRDLRADLAAHVRRASTGERLVITVDGRPAAQLGPIMTAGSPTLADLASAGLVRLPGSAERRDAPVDLPLVPVDVSGDDIVAELRGGR